MLAVDDDTKGQTFIAAWEGIDYPIYGTQFHPERNAFEWDPAEPINHSPQAIECVQDLANFFVDEARKSLHGFSSPQDEQAALIYMCPAPLYEVSYNPYYTQVYFSN